MRADVFILGCSTSTVINGECLGIGGRCNEAFRQIVIHVTTIETTRNISNLERLTLTPTERNQILFNNSQYFF
jgi:hypothetical protein